MENLSGWVCPKCGNVYSPFIPECANCNKNIQPIIVKKEKDSETLGNIEMSAEILTEWFNGPKEGGD